MYGKFKSTKSNIFVRILKIITHFKISTKFLRNQSNQIISFIQTRFWISLMDLF